LTRIWSRSYSNTGRGSREQVEAPVWQGARVSHRSSPKNASLILARSSLTSTSCAWSATAEPWPLLWTRRRPAATAFTCLLRLRRSQSNRARSHSAAAAIAAATITTARAALSGLQERAYHSSSTHTGNVHRHSHQPRVFRMRTRTDFDRWTGW
jgi:hypothetical protein